MLKNLFLLGIVILIQGCASSSITTEEEPKLAPIKHVALDEVIAKKKDLYLAKNSYTSSVENTDPPDNLDLVHKYSSDKLIPPIIGFRSYDESNDGKKIGLQIKSNSYQDIKASDNGVVIYAGKGVRGYRNLIIIKHSGNLMTTYANSSYIKTKEGDMVKKGQVIGVIDPSDFSEGVLHFGVRLNGKCVDPHLYLTKAN